MISICIIGFGKVGSAIAYESDKNQFKISGIIDRNERSILNEWKKMNIISKPSFKLTQELIDITDVFIICVQDKYIKDVIGELSAFQLKNKILIHTSGILSSQIFSKLKLSSSNFGSMHPAQTFPKISKKNNSLLSNIIFGIQGGDKAISVMRKIIKSLNSTFVVINTKDKTAYHLLCVAASNLLIANLDMINELGKIAGLKKTDIFKITNVLISNTLNNYIKSGNKALTGPVARNDKESIENHINFLEDVKPEYLKFYKETIKLLFNIKAKK